MTCFLIFAGVCLLGSIPNLAMTAPEPESQSKEQTMTQVEERWIHPQCNILPSSNLGPFVELSDGSIMAVSGGRASVSKDDGKTWSTPLSICEGPAPGIPGGGPLIRTRDGAIVLVYVDKSSWKRDWDGAKGKWHDDVHRDVWTIRSLDEGRTWVDRQQIPPEWYEGFCGPILDGIQTRSGRVVVPIQIGLRHPGHVDHWVTRTIVSDDDGRTWERGNLIDLGGHGNHDGAIEATLAELSDGRVMMLIRTMLDQFWKAYSSDHGHYWREIMPSQIDASTSPGYLLNLASGRLVLVWNRLYPEGREDYPRRAGVLSEIGASWHRRELSIAFSEDDGDTWTEPVVFARGGGEGEYISYPYIFERRAGELWITTRYNRMNSEKLPPVCISLQEEDFIVK